MNLVEARLRSPHFLIIVVLGLGLAQLLVPSGSAFFSSRFMAILLSAVLGALWASAKIRREDGGSVIVYPLLIGAMIMVALLAKFVGRLGSSVG